MEMYYEVMKRLPDGSSILPFNLEKKAHVLADLLGIKANSRKKELIYLRYRFANLVVRKWKFTLEETGSIINRNHSSVIHYLKNEESMRQLSTPKLDAFWLQCYNKTIWG